MYVGRQTVRVVERADAHKADHVAEASVMAPESDLALRTTEDVLPFPAC